MSLIFSGTCRNLNLSIYLTVKKNKNSITFLLKNINYLFKTINSLCFYFSCYLFFNEKLTFPFFKVNRITNSFFLQINTQFAFKYFFLSSCFKCC